MLFAGLMRRKLPRSDGNHLWRRCRQLHAGGTTTDQHKRHLPDSQMRRAKAPTEGRTSRAPPQIACINPVTVFCHEAQKNSLCLAGHAPQL